MNKFPTYPLVKMTTNRKQTYIFLGLNNPTTWVNLEWPEVYDCPVNTPGKATMFFFSVLDERTH